MRWFVCWIVSICFLLPLSAFAAKIIPKTLEHHSYRVIKVIDGDTIKLDNGQLVRLIGIDAPETKQGPKFDRDLKKRQISKSKELAMGRRSWQYAKSLLEGKKVHMELDRQTYDDYHRLLAYVYLTNGIFVNKEIIKKGFAYPYAIKPNIKYAKIFDELYEEARQEHQGLWQEQKKASKAVRWFHDH